MCLRLHEELALSGFNREKEGVGGKLRLYQMSCLSDSFSLTLGDETEYAESFSLINNLVEFVFVLLWGMYVLCEFTNTGD